MSLDVSSPDAPLLLTREGPVASLQFRQSRKLNAIGLRSRCGLDFRAGGDVSYFTSPGPSAPEEFAEGAGALSAAPAASIHHREYYQ
jgi:hypothetical protein